MFVRIYPDEENFNIFNAIDEIRKHIKKSTKYSSKSSLIKKTTKRLLQLKFEKHNSI